MQTVWHRDEISAALASIDGVNRAVAGEIDTPEMRLYRMGFEAAIAAIAAMFQVQPPPTIRRIAPPPE